MDAEDRLGMVSSIGIRAEPFVEALPYFNTVVFVVCIHLSI
jgi:hypothetical protein